MNISAISRCNQSEAALDRPANFSNFMLRKFFCGCARRWIEKLLNSPRNEGRSGGGFSVSFEFMASGAGHLHLNPILVVVGVGSFVLSCLLLSCSSGWNGVKCYSFNGQLVIWINLNFPLFCWVSAVWMISPVDFRDSFEWTIGFEISWWSAWKSDVLNEKKLEFQCNFLLVLTFSGNTAADDLLAARRAPPVGRCYSRAVR